MFCVRHPYLTIVQATGNYEATKIGALVEAVINIAVSIILIQFIGINGVIVGTLVANLIRTIQFAIFSSRKILHRDIKRAFFRFLWLISDSTVIVVVSRIITGIIAFNSGWTGWILEAIIVFIISCIVTVVFSLIFYKKDFLRLANTLLVMAHIKRYS